MGVEILGLLGLSSVFALIGLVLAGWMAWRIVEKAGLPGWAGLGAILLTLTGIGTIVPLILLWVFAFMRWPRDEMAGAAAWRTSPGRPASPAALPPPPAALADRRAWRLSGRCRRAAPWRSSIDGSPPAYLLTGAPPQQANELSVPDPSVGQPHARLLRRRRPARPGGSRHAGRHLHRRRPAAARARSARHQRGARQSGWAAVELALSRA